MKKTLAILLQFVVALVGIGALALLLWEPHIEGRNANSTVFEVYFRDPFLAYAYIASIPFFVALSRAYKVLGYVGQDKLFTPAAVRAMGTIKKCAMAIVGFVALGEVYLFLDSGSDDRAGGVFVGALIIFCSIMTASVAARYEKILLKGR